MRYLKYWGSLALVGIIFLVGAAVFNVDIEDNPVAPTVESIKSFIGGIGGCPYPDGMFTGTGGRMERLNAKQPRRKPTGSATTSRSQSTWLLTC